MKSQPILRITVSMRNFPAKNSLRRCTWSLSASQAAFSRPWAIYLRQ